MDCAVHPSFSEFAGRFSVIQIGTRGEIVVGKKWFTSKRNESTTDKRMTS